MKIGSVTQVRRNGRELIEFRLDSTLYRLECQDYIDRTEHEFGVDSFADKKAAMEIMKEANITP